MPITLPGLWTATSYKSKAIHTSEKAVWGSRAYYRYAIVMGKMRFGSRKSYTDLVIRPPIMVVKPAMNPSRQLFIICIVRISRYIVELGPDLRPRRLRHGNTTNQFHVASRDRPKRILQYRHGVIVDYFQPTNKMILKSFRCPRKN